jgi:hypothetical protein
MKPPEDIKRYFQKATLSTNPERHEAVFEKILSAQEQANKNEPASSRINLGRLIMKSPISKIAIAAIVVIAAITGLTMFDKTSGVVLADVLTKIERIGAYKYQMDMTSTGSQSVGNTKMDINQVLTGYMIMSQEYGMKMKIDILNADNHTTTVQETYLLIKEKSLLTISHTLKSYTRMEIDDTQIDRMKNQNYDPGKMVEQFLTSEYKSLGISTIDGIRVEGFETNDTKYAGGMFDKVDIKLWIDVKTQLPVLMDMDCRMKEPMNIAISGVIDDFQWNVPVDAAEFEPIIPGDYKSALGGSIKMPAHNEETVIQGLKLYADFTGRYPEELNLTILTSHVREITQGDTPASKQLQEELKGLKTEERSQKLMDVFMPIQGAVAFYMFLVQDHKDPAYYGDIVTPQDFDQVLLRWKVSDNEYRVIFGSLHAETVTKEVLAELEQNLPKK